MASISQPADRTPRQLDLPLAIEDVPDIVRDYGLVETHSYPWVSQGDPHWFVRRVPTAVAWNATRSWSSTVPPRGPRWFSTATPRPSTT